MRILAEKQAIVCTIVSHNYLNFALAVCNSYLRRHPGQPFVVLVVDEPSTRPAGLEYPFEILYAKDLPMEDFRAVSFQFDVLELNHVIELNNETQRRFTDCIDIYSNGQYMFYLIGS